MSEQLPALVADPQRYKAIGKTDASAMLGTAVDVAVASVAAAMLRRMLKSMGNPPIRFVLWNGQAIPSPNGRYAPASVILHDPGALLNLVRDPELQFGEMYAAQRLTVNGDLPEFLERIYLAAPRNPSNGASRRVLAISDLSRSMLLRRARQSIRHHYDVGNDFYRQWLDPNLIYTCAYFPTRSTSLADAQVAKMDLVCRKLRLKPGDRVIEAGCGWGAMAIHMAKNYGVSVSAYNISAEQMNFARERARQEGLDQQITFIEDDYRNAYGQFDAFVSIGMLEHVGPEHFAALGKQIERLLVHDGRGLIHTIGRDYPRRLDKWIERHIFPEACPPSLGQMMSIFEPSGFSVLDVENLRLHYAKTLEHWLQRFNTAESTIAQSHSAQLIHTWRLYLAGSLAAFRSGEMQLFQVLFSRARNNRIPWLRAATA